MHAHTSPTVGEAKALPEQYFPENCYCVNFVIPGLNLKYPSSTHQRTSPSPNHAPYSTPFSTTLSNASPRRKEVGSSRPALYTHHLDCMWTAWSLEERRGEGGGLGGEVLPSCLQMLGCLRRTVVGGFHLYLPCHQ